VKMMMMMMMMMMMTKTRRQNKAPGSNNSCRRLGQSWEIPPFASPQSLSTSSLRRIMGVL